MMPVRPSVFAPFVTSITLLTASESKVRVSERERDGGRDLGTLEEKGAFVIEYAATLLRPILKVLRLKSMIDFLQGDH